MLLPSSLLSNHAATNNYIITGLSDDWVYKMSEKRTSFLNILYYMKYHNGITLQTVEFTKS